MTFNFRIGAAKRPNANDRIGEILRNFSSRAAKRAAEGETLENIQITKDDKTHVMNVALSGRIDSVTAPEVEKKLLKALEGYSNMAVVVDVEKLGYISSAGLRVLLDLQTAISAMFADGHGAFWKKFFARYTQNQSEEKRAFLVSVLKPGIKPWW